jgi:hypothetical protein
MESAATEADGLLRQRLGHIDPTVAYVVFAVLPNGAGVIRSNVGAELLQDMGRMLIDIAKGAGEPAVTGKEN